MSLVLPDEAVIKLINGCIGSELYAQAAYIVAAHFRSMHYMSSRLICACTVANLILNDDISPRSADRIVTCARRDNKSLYTTVDNAYKFVETEFCEYAECVLGKAEYSAIKELKLRNANFLVYVLSCDIKRNIKFDKSATLYSAFSYDDIEKYGLSVYDR